MIKNSSKISCAMKKAQRFRKKHEECVIHLENISSELLKRQEFWTDFAILQTDVLSTYRDFQNKCRHDSQIKSNQRDVDIESTINCVFFNRWHDFLMPLVYQQYEIDDDEFYNKSLELCKINVTAEQMGAPEDYAIPLSAAIVELSTLDNHRSPVEKLQCLGTTYDLIFAQLKAAKIDIIASQTGSNNVIPVIESSDVVPVLMTVTVRSKLVHFISNLQYADIFVGDFSKYYCDARNILDTFKEAVERLKAVSKENLRPGSGKILRELDLVKFIKISSENDSKTAEEIECPLDREVFKMANLIITSTNENYPTT